MMVQRMLTSALPYLQGHLPFAARSSVVGTWKVYGIFVLVRGRQQEEAQGVIHFLHLGCSTVQGAVVWGFRQLSSARPGTLLQPRWLL
jgi:hypothetical protein